MQTSSKPVSRSVHEDKQPPVASFKNSLLAWQAGTKHTVPLGRPFPRKHQARPHSPRGSQVCLPIRVAACRDFCGGGRHHIPDHRKGGLQWV
jgi:hypothetical protein